jgi:hypothetical protein
MGIPKNKEEFIINLKDQEYIKISNQDTPDKTIYVSGDIHGDYTALITILTELSGACEITNPTVFKQFCETPYINYESSIYKISDIPIRWKNTSKNIIIVFCGDLIDNKRNENAGLYFPHEEIKLVLTLYKLQVDALNSSSGNMIYKTMGNHEYENFIGNTDFSSKFGVSDEIGFNGGNKIYRKDYFTYQTRANNYFYYHFFYNFPILRINNNIFLHAGLHAGNNYAESILDNNTNKIIEYNNHIINSIIANKHIQEMIDKSPLWTRIYSESSIDIQNPQNTEKSFLNNVRNISNPKYNPFLTNTFINNNVRIFVGHCITSVYSDNFYKIKNYWRTIKKGAKTLPVSGFIKKYQIRSVEDTDDNNTQKYLYKDMLQNNQINKKELQNDELDRTFGISMNRVNKKSNLIKIFRLDTGVSYSFDKEATNRDIFHVLHEMYARKPQIIELLPNTNM